jgi:glyoxylase-like metal-dependent hydrolase (beta-lactamase superfamily II)
MRLTPDVSLVAGGPFFGFGLTSGTDAHCYLIDGGESLALIDCGMGTATSKEQLLSHATADGHDLARLERLFITHYHADHCAGAAAYRDALGLAVVAGRETAAALEAGDQRATSFEPARTLGLYPADSQFPACPVDEVLDDGDSVSVGRLTVRFVATPGHCSGHGAYLVTGGDRTYLFSGDSLFAGGRLLLQATHDCDLQLSLASVRTLAALEFDSLLPGHGPLALTSGPAHVAAAVAAIDRLSVPPSLV